MTSRSNRRNAGFTLIEMVVVIAVLGLVLAVLLQYRPLRSHWMEMQGAAGRIAAAMSMDRARAIGGGAPVPLALPKLPAWLAVRVIAPPGGIVFEPDGSATGGVVVLAEAQRQVTVTADWLTGRVRVDAR